MCIRDSLRRGRRRRRGRGSHHGRRMTGRLKTLMRPIEVLEDEAWEVPDSLSDDDWRAQSGWDGRRPVDGMNEEDEG